MVIMTLTEKIISVLAVVFAVGFVSYSGFHYVKKLGYDEAVSIYEKQKAKDKAITDAAQAQLQLKADQAAKDKQDALKAADVKYAALADSLRKRPTRPSQAGSSATARSTGSCTGSELYREDAEFLAGEAARADKVTIERDYYYERYEDARNLLAGTKSVGGQQGTVSDTEFVSGDRVQP